MVLLYMLCVANQIYMYHVHVIIIPKHKQTNKQICQKLKKKHHKNTNQPTKKKPKVVSRKIIVAWILFPNCVTYCYNNNFDNFGNEPSYIYLANS